MKKTFLFIGLFILGLKPVLSQDTFSIVAVDSLTGEVGSAGASCVDLFNTSFTDDSFLGVLVPGTGAINTQASYLSTNQNNATNRMLLGNEPDSIIGWLVANDVQNNPLIRQYGIAAFVNGSPKTAAHTGTSTFNYKSHILGPNFSIQGNILLGQKVLDSMEARFLREPGDLSCKLMAALQGANMVGADTRCTSNGTSSLFAFVKVSAPGDSIGFPYFKLSVRTHNGDQIEPIDSLQILFNQVKTCASVGVGQNLSQHSILVFPNPTREVVKIHRTKGDLKRYLRVVFVPVFGIEKKEFVLQSGEGELNIEGLADGMYFYSVYDGNSMLDCGKISVQH